MNVKVLQNADHSSSVPKITLPFQQQYIREINCKHKPRLELNLSSKSISSTKTPRSSLLNHSSTPKVDIFKTINQKPTLKIFPFKSLIKPISIKPIDRTEILKFPISSIEILTLCPEVEDWVKTELENYTEVHYFSKVSKYKPKDFDDDKGDYKIVFGDDIHYRYEILDILGKGSFGQVIKVQDHLRKKPIALKIIKSRQRYTEQARIEIELLKLFRNIDVENKYNIVHLEDDFVFRGHVMITFELLGLNLYELLKRNSFRGLSVGLVKRFSYNVLQSLALLAKNYVIHCDLKPENVLLSDTNLMSVKLIDFGSSCYINQRVYTYIQSRFYRAPEVVLGIPYTSAIDIWSFGCILVELYTGIPIFPAKNEKELINFIVEVLGMPPVSLIIQGTRSQIFFSDPSEKVNLLESNLKKAPGSRTIRSILKGADENFIQMIEGCIQWEPKCRITAINALKSPWFIENVETASKTTTRRCKISIEDITKHTPQLQKFIAGRANTMK
ncbi:hypothetical protein SteCoe_29510 [Stentor coeruleus]|uniref:Protein kinase domain-containing protein n=1 Tax=Stentor coeruleus TaxID=5963 RepID=A0A1R2B5U3_9CILI|nr:hypothetical protein SteCoe_29510 [Stentor coeruleus]